MSTDLYTSPVNQRALRQILDHFQLTEGDVTLLGRILSLYQRPGIISLDPIVGISGPNLYDYQARTKPWITQPQLGIMIKETELSSYNLTSRGQWDGEVDGGNFLTYTFPEVKTEDQTTQHAITLTFVKG